MNQESEYQVRPISFVSMIQKSLKNRTLNRLKKLTFTTLRPTRFEIFLSKFQVIAFYFPNCLQTAKKSFIFQEKAAVCPPVYYTL